MKKYIYFLLLAGHFSLQGCVLLVAAGAGAATTAVVVNEKRSLPTFADDKNIELTANTNVLQSPVFSKNTHIVIIAFNHAVLLTGQVPSQSMRESLASMVQALPKVARIYNHLEISPSTTPLIRSNDAWITAKIKADMLTTKDLHSGQIKVITENGSVYLMGIVNQYQAKMASNVARRVNGVKRVIQLFQYTYVG